MKRLLTILLTISLIFISMNSKADAQEKERSITIGLSLVYTGALGGTAAGICDGFLDHLMWINQQGGVEYKDPGTRKVERIKMDLKWEDNAYNASKSLSIYKRLKAAGAKVICVLGSTPLEAISPSLSRDKIPGFCFYGGASPAAYRQEPLYVMASSCTLIEDFCTHVKWFMSSWKKDRPPKIGGITMDAPSFRALENPEGVPAYVEKMGGKWVGMEWLPVVVTDSSVQLNRLLSKGVDMIAITGGTSHTIVVAKDMYRLGVDRQNVTVTCCTPSWDEGILTMVPKEAEGFYVASAYTFAFENTPGSKLAREVRKWRGRTAEEMGPYLRGFAAGYGLKEALKVSLEKVGYEKLTPTDIRDAMFHLRDVDTGGLMKTLTVREPDYPYFYKDIRFAKIQNGEFKIIGDWIELERITFGRK